MSRIKNFAYLLYPESCKVDWLSICCEQGIPFYWILHDKDTKKTHFHLFFTAKNAISENTVKKIGEKIGSANGTYQCVASKLGFLRYLVHKDNPEKHQYDVSEVNACCGASYDETQILSDLENKSKSFDLMQEMIDYIDSNDVYLYCDFVRYCIAFRRDWFNVLISPQGRVFDKYIKSMYWAKTHL